MKPDCGEARDFLLVCAHLVLLFSHPFSFAMCVLSPVFVPLLSRRLYLAGAIFLLAPNICVLYFAYASPCLRPLPLP